MRYEQFIPGGLLSDSVEFCLLTSFSRDECPIGRESHFPAVGSLLVFNLGAPHVMVEQDQARLSLRQAWFVGERTQAVQVEPTGQTHVACVRFKPGQARRFFDVPMEYLTDRVSHLEDLWPGTAERTRQRLSEVESMHETVKILVDVLTARRRDMEPSFSLFKAIDHLQRTSDSELRRSTAETAAAIGVTERTMLRHFRDWVGLGPKTLQRRSRFRRAIELQNASPTTDWSAIAQSCGYYDQSHFVRDFVSFSGVNPEAYRERRGSTPGTMLVAQDERTPQEQLRAAECAESQLGQTARSQNSKSPH